MKKYIYIVYCFYFFYNYLNCFALEISSDWFHFYFERYSVGSTKILIVNSAMKNLYSSFSGGLRQKMRKILRCHVIPRLRNSFERNFLCHCPYSMANLESKFQSPFNSNVVNSNLTPTCPIGLPPHAPIAQKLRISADSSLIRKMYVFYIKLCE